MVATRKGVRVSSPTKTNPEQPSDVQDTPSTGRRTRRAAKLEETLAQHTLAETCSKLEKGEIETRAPIPSSTKKRCTRASRLHSPEQPCTPVDSSHEADMSDLESCCSVVSDPEPPPTCPRRRRPSRAGSRADGEISEVDSCSSAVSGSKPGYSARRSTRRNTALAGAGVEPTLETESCSSVVSESQRVTRSQRKTARTRPTPKQHTEDSELSDADSCPSTTSRQRSRRQLREIPLHLDELSESSQSPVRTSQRTRAARGKAETSVDISEPASCESEGFECGPTYGLTSLRRGRSRSAGPKAADAESEATDVLSSAGSPGSTRGRGTPCSSRTGSGTSSRAAPASTRSVKDCSVVLENTEVTEDNSLNDSRLESTVIAEDADCTLLEENDIEISEEQEAAINTAEDTLHLSSSDANLENVEKEMTDVSEEDVAPKVSVCSEDTSEPAVIAVDQQEVPSAETDRDASEMEMMQETVPPSEPPGPRPSVTVTTCEKASEVAEEEQEAADAHLSDTDQPPGEDAAVETGLDDEEKMEVSEVKAEAQQVVDSSAAQAVSVQVTSTQQQQVTVHSESEQQPKDVLIQRTKTISLLDSSDDDDDDDEEFDKEESDVSEDLDPRDGETAGPSDKSEAAAASCDGLFMIDTRPGQEADEDYYREGHQEAAEQEEEEEFVDEEADDDDDEDAKVLFSSRDSHSKELSSRIDPGIRMKELGGLYISFDGSKSKPVSSSLQKLKEKKIQDEVMKKSVIGPDFEKKDAVPPYSESKQALKLKHRAEREKSTGDGWFNMKAPEMSQELKGDLKVLKMRGSLDPKRFYKKNDRDGFPKYFQFGTVVDSPVDFYHSRIPKKERKRTMVEELLADAEFRHQNKKRFQHIMTEKAAQGAGKRNKKKRKFHKT